MIHGRALPFCFPRNVNFTSLVEVISKGLLSTGLTRLTDSMPHLTLPVLFSVRNFMRRELLTPADGPGGSLVRAQEYSGRIWETWDCWD